jgi:hypothetical protein
VRRESRPADNEAASTAADDSQYNDQPDNKPGKSLVWIPCTRALAPQDTRSQLKRRSGAAKRSVPLDCGHRDPLLCDCTQPPLSNHAIDGWRSSAEHVLATGQIPLLPIEVLQALWRRGGSDRALAEQLHEASGGVLR